MGLEGAPVAPLTAWARPWATGVSQTPKPQGMPHPAAPLNGSPDFSNLGVGAPD